MKTSFALKFKTAINSLSNGVAKILGKISVPAFLKGKNEKQSSASSSQYSYPAPAYLADTDKGKNQSFISKISSFFGTKFKVLRKSTSAAVAKLVSKINASGKIKVTDKLVRVAGAFILALIFLFIIWLNFGFVKVSQGIETTRGPSENINMFISKTDEASNNDLVVAVLPGTGVDSEELLVVGTVFSSNDEYHAIYDGEVIWQVPMGQIRGKVLFASATQTP